MDNPSQTSEQESPKEPSEQENPAIEAPPDESNGANNTGVETQPEPQTDDDKPDGNI